MHDNRSHPLLEQVPLTVSPFVQLPRATTLPYRYKAMPSALPPSIIEGGNGSNQHGQQDPLSSSSGRANKTPYVVSPASSLAAHPDDILASCHALLAHLDRMEADADAELQALEARIQERELAEKRRLAPGWLDSEARLLIPERKDNGKDVLGENSGSGSSAAGGTQDGHAAAADNKSPFQLSEMSAALPEAAGTDTTGGFSADELMQAFGSSKT